MDSFSGSGQGDDDALYNNNDFVFVRRIAIRRTAGEAGAAPLELQARKAKTRRRPFSLGTIDTATLSVLQQENVNGDGNGNGSGSGGGGDDDDDDDHELAALCGTAESRQATFEPFLFEEQKKRIYAALKSHSSNASALAAPRWQAPPGGARRGSTDDSPNQYLVTGFNHITVATRDLQQSIWFYEKVRPISAVFIFLFF